MSLKWSGFDIRNPPGHGLAKRMSNPKLHLKLMFASGPYDSSIRKSTCRDGMRMLESDHERRIKHDVFLRTLITPITKVSHHVSGDT